MLKQIHLWAIFSSLGAIILVSCLPSGSSGSQSSQASPQCSDLTAKGAQECEKANAIAGKTCSFEFDSCVELTASLKDFRAADMNFEVKIPAGGSANLATDKALGAGHSDSIDWNGLCGITTAKNHIMEAVVEQISLAFAKDKKEVSIAVDCSRGGGTTKTFALGYGAKPVQDEALLITVDLKSQDVQGEIAAAVSGTAVKLPARNGNLLEFFSKANWLYSKKKNAVLGISQLGTLGFRQGYPMLPLKEEKDFDNAFDYARKPSTPGPGGGGYEIAEINGKTVGAISFIFDKR